MDFLWHNLSEKEKEEIKKQVNSTIELFSKKLSEIKGDIEENFIERNVCEREENGKSAELSKEIMLDNAPEKNENFIIAERKGW